MLPFQDTTFKTEWFDLTKKKLNFLLISAGALYVLVSGFYLNRYPTLFGDESLYNEPCYNFLELRRFATNLYPPIGGLEQSNLIQGRIFNFFQAAIFKFFGVTVFTIRIQSFLFGLLALFLTYKIAAEIFSSPAIGLWASTILALSHFFIFASHFGRPDMTVSAFILYSVYFFLIAKKSAKPLFFLLSGLAAALAIDIHPPGNIAVFILGALVAHQFLAKEIRWKELFLIGGGITLGILWWFIIHIAIHPELFQMQQRFIRVAQPIPLFSFSPLRMLYEEFFRWYKFFWLGAYHRNMFLLLLFVCSFIFALFKLKEMPMQIVLSVILGGLIGFTVGSWNKTPLYIIYLYPFLIILLAKTLYNLSQSPRSMVKASANVLCLCLTLFFLLECVERFKFYHSSYENYFEKVKLHIPKGSVVYANEVHWVGLKDHARLFPMHVLSLKSLYGVSSIMQVPYFRGTFADLLIREKVQYIVGDDELIRALMYQEETRSFLDEHCGIVAEIQDPFYNWSNYMSKRSPQPLLTKIFKVNKPTQ